LPNRAILEEVLRAFLAWRRKAGRELFSLLAMIGLGNLWKRRIVWSLPASTIRDVRGKVLRDACIVVPGSKIVAIHPKASPID
jgi:hypothetical protein